MRNDGYFQAQHKGDVFTYRFADLGYGTGDTFQPVDLGEPDFSRPVVTGDTIRWSEVFADVDVTVRYIHDIMKVDVILKREFMRDLRAVVSDVSLSRDAFLTARFDIDLVEINSEARQGGRARDVYAPSLALDTPLEFVQDDKVVHRLRPVEVFTLDESGNPVLDTERAIRTNQVWQLRRNAVGMAEMSAQVDGLVDLPDGSVVIDPSMTFNAQSAVFDSLLDKSAPTTKYGSNSDVIVTREDRFVIGFDAGSSLDGKTITSTKLQLTIENNGLTTTRNFRAYKITEGWHESFVTWNNTGFVSDWTEPGGTFESNNYISPPVSVPNWLVEDDFEIDVSQIFKSHFSTNNTDSKTKGFLVKREDDLTASDQNFLDLATKDHSLPSFRPRLVVTHDLASFGGDVGSTTITDPSTDTRQERMKVDNLPVIRLFAQNANLTGSLSIAEFVQKASNKGMKVIMVFICGPVWNFTGENWWDDPGPRSYTGKTEADYANWVEDRLDAVDTYINNGTVIAAEVGNEEESAVDTTGDGIADKSKWPENVVGIVTNDPAKMYEGGKDFARYYVAARNRIQSLWPNLQTMSGNIENSKTLSFPDHTNNPGIGQVAKAFLSGFIDGVTTHVNGGFDQLPEMLAIHGYSGHLPPEFYHDADTGGGSKEWILRVDDLFNTGNPRGYIPNFVTTEFGFSPVPGSSFAPLAPDASVTYPHLPASEYTQAVYYMRSVLMSGTISGATGGWSQINYFQHTTSPAQTEIFGNAVSKTAHIIHSITSSDFPGLASGGLAAGWIPAKSERNEVGMDPVTGDSDSTSFNTMRCGWINPNGVQWGAIWKYKNRAGRFFNPGETPLSFSVPGNTVSSLKAHPFKFIFTSPFSIANTSWVSLSTGITGTYDPGNDTTSYLIPQVDGNPVFIKFAP